ncbi:copper resistance CopC family protein [Microbacterium sp. AZCO]|uniref:copper resistance CopC family protein n=1 Tax=Microbacterium sp. AZCO TaxID=3142976 RepID=UPI0031F367B6
MSSQGIHKSRPLNALAALALAAAAVFATAVPASAHDELLSSDPAADSSVDALPAQLTLTFSGLISTEPGANEVAVTDAAGASLVEGTPTVSDTVITQKLAGEASGVVTVLWKAVSSDGHPISGQYSFTVSGASTPTPTATPTESASATPAESPVATSTPTAPPTEEASETGPWPWVLLIVALLAVAAAVIYLLASRARRQRALADSRRDTLPGGPGAAPGPGSEPPAER